MRSKNDLRAGQKLIASQIKGCDAKLIISGMGSGKTGATLAAVTDLLNEFRAQHVLVIGPWFVAKSTWPNEIAEWAFAHNLDYAVAVGDEAERIAAIKRRAEITFINFDNLQWLAKQLRTVNNWYWDTVVIDEMSRMKSGEGRTKTTTRRAADGTKKVTKGGNQTRFGILTTARRKIARIYGLTGTPAPQGLADLWGQVYLLDQGERLGRSKAEFERRWFNKDQYSHTMTPKSGAEADILSRLSDVLITIPPEKVAEDPIYIPMYVDLPAPVLRDYKEFEKTLYSEPHDVEAVSSGVLANKLLQFANGHLYREDRSVVKVHDAKFQALDELHDAVGDESLLIFYSFQFDKDEMKRRYPGIVVANEYKGDLVNDWNKGKIKRLAAHPASIGHGTNLQYGGHLAAWFGMTFSLELWQQANMRLPRPGQKEQVLIYQITARGTYDEKAVKMLNRKDATQSRIVKSFIPDFHSVSDLLSL
jgi:hypothetical protein